MISLFTVDDYNEVYQLWKRTPGVGLRSLDDSKEGIEMFLHRNPTTNFIATLEGHIVGSILSGHDGRRGYLYHVCVEEAYRRRLIGKILVEYVVEAMKVQKINKLALVCYSKNKQGNLFWSGLGWELRSDLNYYTISINNNNE